MPITPPLTPPAPLTYTIGDLCIDALIETGAAAPGEEANIPGEELQWTFRQANYMLDVWEAMRKFVYSVQFQVFTFAVNTNPQLIGPSPAAQFAVTQRPVKIESAALILNAGSPVDIPINVRDKNWWALNQVKSTKTNVPSDLYYNPTNPDGQMFFWPVINISDQVRLQFWTNVSQFASLDDPIDGPNGYGTMPAAYRAAMMTTLAEALCPGLGREVHPMLAAKALAARTAVFGNNSQIPRISTQDFGMPRAGGVRGDFNWFTGGRPGGAPQ